MSLKARVWPHARVSLISQKARVYLMSLKARVWPHARVYYGMSFLAVLMVLLE